MSGSQGPKIRTASPPGYASRAVAADILGEVLERRKPLDAVLEAASAPGGGLTRLEQRDRGFVRLLIGTALRRHGQIADALSARLERGLPKKSGRLGRILEIAATQILFLDPAAHAAVSLAVEQAGRDADAKHFKGLANAVLRGLARERDAVLAGQDAARLNTPDWLWRRWEARYGADGARIIAEDHLNEAPLDISVKSDPEDWAERLGGRVLPGGTIRLAAHGQIEALPGFTDGAWWVQDAAAAIPARLLGDVAGRTVADLCAAPGGKTAQLASAGAAVTAYDQSASRLRRLEENLARLRLEVKTVAADLRKDEVEGGFDAVLLDAPCSATGTIRRHPDVAWLKSETDIASLAEVQGQLLKKAAAMLRPGGTLVYCTCSLEPEEGEAQAERALKTLPLEPLPIDPGEANGLAVPAGPAGLRTLPEAIRNDDPRLAGLAGFFIARFRRR